MYLNWLWAGWECGESVYGWRALTVRCKWCSLLLPRLCCLQCSGLHVLPWPAFFPSVLWAPGAPTSLPPLPPPFPLAEEIADTDGALPGACFNPSTLDPKRPPFKRYLHSQHFSNSAFSLSCSDTPRRVSLYIARLCGAREISLFGWLKLWCWLWHLEQSRGPAPPPRPVTYLKDSSEFSSADSIWHTTLH